MPQQHAERGMALAMVLVVGLLLSITVMAVLRTVGFRFHSVENQRQRDTGFYAAEAGLQAVWVKLQRQIPPFNDQGLAGWPVNTSKTDTVTLFGDNPDPTKHRDVTITVTRVTTNPGPRQFKVQAMTALPGGS